MKCLYILLLFVAMDVSAQEKSFHLQIGGGPTALRKVGFNEEIYKQLKPYGKELFIGAEYELKKGSLFFRLGRTSSDAYQLSQKGVVFITSTGEPIDYIQKYSFSSRFCNLGVLYPLNNHANKLKLSVILGVAINTTNNENVYSYFYSPIKDSILNGSHNDPSLRWKSASFNIGLESRYPLVKDMVSGVVQVQYHIGSYYGISRTSLTLGLNLNFSPIRKTLKKYIEDYY